MVRIANTIILVGLLLSLVGCSSAPMKADSINHKSTTTIQPTVAIEITSSPAPKNLFIGTPIPPTMVIPTATLAQTESPSPIMLKGVFYLWEYRAEDPLYTKVNFPTRDLPLFLELSVSPKEMVSENKKPFSLAFAPYSSTVAYLTTNGQSIDLWLADLNLDKIEHLWRDDRNWLGSSSDTQMVKIKWGPADSSLILSSDLVNLKNHLVIYLLKAKKVVEGLGSCNQVAPFPDSNQLTVWCLFEEGTPAPYGFFTQDGDLVFTKTIPENTIEVIEWSFAPDGSRIAVIPKQGNVIVEDYQDKRIEIPVHLLSAPGDYRTKPFLQWSNDGERLLVYGYNPEQCPLRENPTTGKLEEKECWLVVNSRTGEILWGPNMSAKEIQEVTRLPLTNLHNVSAGLSPDNNYIVISYIFGAMEFTIIIDLNNNEKVLLFSSSHFDDFKWVEN